MVEIRPRVKAAPILIRVAVEGGDATPEQVERILEEALHRAKLCECHGEGCFSVVAVERPDNDE